MGNSKQIYNSWLDLRGVLWAQILLAMALGIIVGLTLSPSMGGVFAATQENAEILGDWFRLPGTIFLNLIQMVVIPLITCSIILGITSAGDPDFLRKVALRIVPYFLATTTVAVLIGAFLASWIRPGDFVDLASFGSQVGSDAQMPEIKAPPRENVASQISALIPSNLAEAYLQKNMIQIVIAAIFVGIAIAALGREKMRPLLTLLQLCQDVVLKIVSWAMRLAPLAVFGLITDFVLRVGVTALIGMSVYIATVIGGLIILLLFYLLIVKMLAGRNPIHFLRNVRDAQLLAFSTSSSAATMPLSLETAEKRLRVHPAIAKFIVPLGATVNMDGTALYQVVAALFMTQIYGIDLTTSALAVLMVTVVGASIGSPSTPGVGIVILATILQSIGVPASGVAILLGVDRVLDMCRTAVNVTGDLTACTVMDKWLAKDVEAMPSNVTGDRSAALS